jgi:hypothetical protein
MATIEDNMDQNNNIVSSAGYSLNKFIESENKFNTQFGGNANTDTYPMNRFDNLVVPLGLDLHADIHPQNGGGKSDISPFNLAVIPEEKFNRLFEKVAKIQTKRKNNTRKRKNI